MDGLRTVKHLFVTWNVAGVKLTTHKDHHQSETCKMKAACSRIWWSTRTSEVLDEVTKMSWFKLRRDDNVAGRDLRIEAVRVKRDEHAENGWHPGD